MALLTATPALAGSSARDHDAPPELPSLWASPFSTGTVISALALRGVRAQVAALALGGEEGGALALAVSAIPLPSRADQAARVLLFVEVDGATLLDQDPDRELSRLEIYAYAVTPEGGVEGHLAQAIPVDVVRLGDAIWQSGLKLYGELELPPGRYRLRVLARSFHSGAYGLRSLELEVPGPGSPPPLLAVIAPPESRDAWLPVRQARPAEAPATSYPFFLGERAVSPSALPVAMGGVPVHGVVFLPAVPVGKLELVGAVRPATGDEDSWQALTVDLRSAETSSHSPLVALPFRLRMPELEAGDYSLALALEDAAGVRLGEARLPLLVARGGWRERHLLWTDLRWLLDGQDLEQLRTAPGVGTELTSRRARREADRRRREDLAQGYLQVLATLGSGSRASARSGLVELERAALGQGSRRELATLQETQLAVAEYVVGHGPESLLPLLALHEELHRMYSQRRLFSLAAHARAMVERLTELYVERDGSRVWAGHALASLGGFQQHANLHTMSQQLFRRALELDPQNGAALIGLATSLEKHDQEREAVTLYRRLVATAPELAEGRLRLALALRRQGDAAGARELLLGLWQGEAAEWIQALTAQELARGYLAEGAYGRASAILEEAIARVPGEPATYSLLAHVYDRTGRPRLATDALARLATLGRSRGPGPSARFLYDRWPRSALETGREELARAAQSRLELLAEVMAGVTAIGDLCCDDDESASPVLPGVDANPHLGEPDRRGAGGLDRAPPGE